MDNLDSETIGNKESLFLKVINPYKNNFALNINDNGSYSSILDKRDRKPVEQVVYFLNSNNQAVYLTGEVIGKVLGLTKFYSSINLFSVGLTNKDTNKLFGKLEWSLKQNGELFLGEQGDKRIFLLNSHKEVLDKKSLYLRALSTWTKSGSKDICLNLLYPEEFSEMQKKKIPNSSD